MKSVKRPLAIVAAGIAALAVAGSGFSVWAQQKEAEDVKVALPAEQVIASIRSAVAAKPGRVLEVESENEKGKTVCEVAILADDGKTYEVEVDVATNKVIEVELDDDKEDDD